MYMYIHAIRPYVHRFRPACRPKSSHDGSDNVSEPFLQSQRKTKKKRKKSIISDPARHEAPVTRVFAGFARFAKSHCKTPGLDHGGVEAETRNETGF